MAVPTGLHSSLNQLGKNALNEAGESSAIRVATFSTPFSECTTIANVHMIAVCHHWQPA